MFRSAITEQTRRGVLKLVRSRKLNYAQIGDQFGISKRSVENIVMAENGTMHRHLTAPKFCKGCRAWIEIVPCVLCQTRKEKGAL